jgi:hypothetical protein
MDGFCLGEVQGGKQKGMRRCGPLQGTLNAADPATVEQRGFSVWLGNDLYGGPHGVAGTENEKAGKATGVAKRSAGVGRLFIYESSAFSLMPHAPGR